jgi:hypothetical protein
MFIIYRYVYIYTRIYCVCIYVYTHTRTALPLDNSGIGLYVGYARTYISIHTSTHKLFWLKNAWRYSNDKPQSRNTQCTCARAHVCVCVCV